MLPKDDTYVTLQAIVETGAGIVSTNAVALRLR
jgi:hypothetical protein